MNDKKNTCKFEDYIESKSRPLQTNQTMSKSAADFKLDRIYPRNIDIKLNLDSKQNNSAFDHSYNGKNSHHLKNTNLEFKMYHEYISLKENQIKSSFRRNKISQIFNIRSINLVEKSKFNEERQGGFEIEKNTAKSKNPSKEFKRKQTEKENHKELHLVIGEKKSASPDRSHLKIMSDNRSTMSFQKFIENKAIPLQKNGDNFDNKLQEYRQYVKESCEFHGIVMKEIENYSRYSIMGFVGKGNNGHLIKEVLKKRWWWGLNEEKKKFCNFIWTQLKEKSYYLKKSQKSISTVSNSHSRSPEKVPARSQSPKHRQSLLKEAGGSKLMQEMSQLQIHNHFENNEYLGNKKALFYNMKNYYERQQKDVFDFLPVTFHVKRCGDQAWSEFTNYFDADLKRNPGERRLWIVKPGQNSNRGNGITIHSDYSKIRDLVSAEVPETNQQRTFIIQKYIDKPFLYNKRKFDIRCYMLLVKLNGSIKGYWYSEGYIRTSCYEYHLEDTSNDFIHLTNDAIQVNSEKYGKYEDGNKLSYQNFQKYLDSNHKNSHYRLLEDICPQLKQIATDSIEATYHLLGNSNGFSTFEIFGLDFMIDENFKPWLIEINTNPCLQTSSSTLERVIPRMVDNAFKLSVDLLFPPPLNWANSKKHFLSNRVSSNSFELIFDEANKGGVSGLMSDQIIVELGQIEENNEIFLQTDDKNLAGGNLADSTVKKSGGN